MSKIKISPRSLNEESMLPHALNLLKILRPETRDEAFSYLEMLRNKFGKEFSTNVFRLAKEFKLSQKTTETFNYQIDHDDQEQDEDLNVAGSLSDNRSYTVDVIKSPKHGKIFWVNDNGSNMIVTKRPDGSTKVHVIGDHKKIATTWQQIKQATSESFVESFLEQDQGTFEGQFDEDSEPASIEKVQGAEVTVKNADGTKTVAPSTMLSRDAQGNLTLNKAAVS